MKRAFYVQCLALAFMVSAQIAFAQLAPSCWPKFHKDYANSGLGIYGGTGSELTWTFAAGGAIKSAPVLGVDGTAYFTCADGRLYAIGGGGVKTWDANWNCVPTSSPSVASDGTIYMGSNDNYLYALRNDGTIKWKKVLGARVESSISIARDGTVYFGCSNGVIYAFKADGTQKWTYTAGGGAISSTPATASDGTVYFGSGDGKLYALTSSGTLKWRLTLQGATAIYAAPTIAPDGVILIGSKGGFFYGVNSNGTQKWRTSIGGDVRSSAAVYSDGSIYFGCRNGKIYALSSIGAIQWTYQTGHYVDSSPAIGIDGGVFVASVDGKLYSLNPDGTLRWSYDAGSAMYSSPAIGPAGALFIGSESGTLYCFAADSTPPGTPTVQDDGLYTAQIDRLHGSWSAIDSESGIFCYEYCIGTAPGLADVAGWANVGGAKQYTRTGLALVDKHTYYITVRAINGAGLVSPEASSDGITVDATPPTLPVVIDDGDFTDDLDRLHASWSSADPECGMGRYEYSIGTAAGRTDVLVWTDAGSSTSVTKTGLSLRHGVIYYFNVRAYNTLGAVSAVGSSNGIFMDSVIPPAPVVTDDGVYTASTTSLHATWTSITCPSGVGNYEYSIGTVQEATDVRSWTSTGIDRQVTATDLSLANGVIYYINVRARNSVGRDGYVGTTDGITVDVTAPTTPVVTDEGAFTGSARQLSASWTSSDPESGIVEFRYAVGSTPGASDIRAWATAGTQTSVLVGSLPLSDGGTYYIAVKAKNGGGAESAVGVSDGITVDLTSPTRPVVNDDGNYTIDATRLHATWSASDPQSGILRYEYSIGTAAGATGVLGWTNAGTATEYTITDLSLTSGLRYYINVRAMNGARVYGEVGSSNGIFVEATPPTTPVVIDDGDYTQNTTTLRARWSSEDPETGVANYKYCIGTQPGLGDIVSWIDVGLATSIERTDLVLQHGVTYYINIKATNGIGLVSEVGSSDGMTVDLTEPPAPVVHDNGEYASDATQLHAVMDCNDPESGVAFYECAVGTSPDSMDICGWTNVGPGPDVFVTGLSLEDGGVYYIRARATNGAGIMGGIGVSDGVKIDSSPPVGLLVWDDGAFTCLDTQLHGMWSAIDPQSGVARFRYCIGSAPGLDDVAPWLDVNDATEHTREGLMLANGQTCYFTVVAINGAGGECAPVSSDGITLDLTPPGTPAVSDSGIYWGYRTNIWASWTAVEDPESGIAEYRMSVGTSPGATDVADWQSVGNQTSHTRTGLHLLDGVTYYINIQAKNGAGLWGDAGSSDGVLIDSTPPTTPVIIDDGDSTSELDRLHATWHSEDPESGIAEYLYCVGTSPGATDVVSWTSAGLAEEITVTGIQLEPMLTYYFSVKSRSNAGAWSAVSASDGIGYATGAAIWWKFRNDAANAGRGLFNATTVSDVGWIIPTQGYIESSPAIAADGTTYIGSGDGNVYAITQNGTTRWVRDLGSSIDSSPAIALDGKIIVGCGDGNVHCLSSAGEPVWAYQTGGAVRSSALVLGDTVYVGSSNGCLYALNLTDGTKAWSYATGGEVWSSPAVDSGGVIYIGSGDAWLYAIKPDGTRKWRFQTGSSVDASPAIGSDGTIYVGSGDGGLYAINPDGTQKWRFNAGFIIDSSAAIGSDGTICFGMGIDGGDGRLYALRPDGTKKWQVDLPRGGVHSSPAIDAAGRVYVGASDGKMHAFNPDGSVLWTFVTGSSVASSPALGADSSVVFGSYDGKIYCLRDVNSRDLTPPTTPVVTVADPALLVGRPLEASWSATDPDTMVAEYTYAIGTEPGLCDVAGWTSAGIETSMSRDDINLVESATYYVSVKARNPSQRWSEIGVSRGVTVVSQPVESSIGNLKLGADGSTVALYEKVVTAVFPDCVFVEEQSRIAGIRCVRSQAEVHVGDVVDVAGTLASVNGEKVIGNANFEAVATREPLGALGLCGYSIQTNGPDVFGLLITIWGKVTIAGPDYCIIETGTGSPKKGILGTIRVSVPLCAVNVGELVRAKGILCREMVDEQIKTVLRVASDEDIVAVD